MGPLTTAAVSRDGSDRWWIVAGLVGLLCRGAPSPQATRLETNAIAETEVFIHSSTHANRHPMGRTLRGVFRLARSGAPRRRLHASSILPLANSAESISDCDRRTSIG